MRQALDIQSKLTAEFSTVPQYQLDLADIHLSIGCWPGFSGASDITEETEYIRRASELLTKLVAQFPDVPLYRYRLATSLHQLAIRPSPWEGRPVADSIKCMEKAIEHFTKLAADFPQVPDYRASLPSCYGCLGNAYETMDWDRCVQLTRKALDVATELAAKYPNVTRYEVRFAVERLRMAERLVGQGELAEAQKLQKDGLARIRAFHESYPDSPYYPSLIVPGNYLLASIDAALGQSAEGPRLRQEADKIFGATYKQLRATRRSSRASLFCGDVVRQLQDFARAWKRTGNHEQMAKAHEQAHKVLSQAIELDPKNAELPIHRGNLYVELKQYDKAIADYREAIRIKDDVAVAHNKLGSVLMRQGKLDEAIACFGKAIKLEQKDAQAHNHLGIALMWQAKLDEASDCFRKAIELAPNDAIIHHNLAFALAEQRKLDVAAAECREAIRLEPKFAQPHNTLGNVLMWQGKLDEAIACHRKAIELEPKDANLHNDLAFALAQQQKLDEAAAYFGKASELVPGNPLCCYWRALALLSGGDLPGYRAACADMLKRFAKTKKADVAHWVAWTTVLAPNSVEQLDQAVHMAELAAQSDAKNESYSTTLGAGQYRAGRFAEADQQLEKVVRALEQDATKPAMVSPAYPAFFLAMAHQRMGHDAEARQWLDKARKRMEQEMQDSSSEAGKSWNRRCTLELLRREAETLLKDTAPANQEPELVAPPREASRG